MPSRLSRVSIAAVALLGPSVTALAQDGGHAARAAFQSGGAVRLDLDPGDADASVGVGDLSPTRAGDSVARTQPD